MSVLQQVQRSLWLLGARGEDGQDIVEYAFLAGLISIAAVAVIVLMGPYLQNAFQDIITAVNSA